MGNLIIKPNTGGLLKLQDEGGTDAISISTTGNTTLAGTANALGTVTSGTWTATDVAVAHGGTGASTAAAAATALGLGTGDSPTFAGFGGTAGQITAKAWVNFNGGSGAEAVRDDFNVSTVADGGTGRYKINFSTAMPNINYSVIVGGGSMASGASAEGMQSSSYDHLVGSVRMNNWSYDGSGYLDINVGCVQVFGD